MSNEYLLLVLKKFENYNNLQNEKIEGYFGFMKAKEKASDNVYLLEVNNLIANHKNSHLIFVF